MSRSLLGSAHGAERDYRQSPLRKAAYQLSQYRGQRVGGVDDECIGRIEADAI